MMGSKKTVTALAAVVALGAFSAFASPAMASAPKWGPAGFTGALDGTVDQSIPVFGTGWSCQWHTAVHARTPGSSTLDVTDATFSYCSGSGGAATCSTTLTASGLPWTATATSNGVSIDGVHADIAFSGATCPFDGWTMNMDGTLSGATWSAAGYALDLSTTAGLVATIGGVPVGSVATSGRLGDPTHTLALL